MGELEEIAYIGVKGRDVREESPSRRDRAHGRVRAPLENPLWVDAGNVRGRGKMILPRARATLPRPEVAATRARAARSRLNLTTAAAAPPSTRRPAPPAA